MLTPRPLPSRAPKIGCLAVLGALALLPLLTLWGAWFLMLGVALFGLNLGFGTCVLIDLCLTAFRLPSALIKR